MSQPSPFDARDARGLQSSRNRFDFQLLQNDFVHRVDDLPSLELVLAQLTDLGYSAHRLDAVRWADQADVYDAFAESFAFPTGGGRHFDGLNDWLRDSAEFVFGTTATSFGTVIAIENFGQFRQFHLSDMLMRILARTAGYAAVVNHLMLVILESAEELSLPATAVPDISYMVNQSASLPDSDL